jgi:hypothetical protein
LWCATARRVGYIASRPAGLIDDGAVDRVARGKNICTLF